MSQYYSGPEQELELSVAVQTLWRSVSECECMCVELDEDTGSAFKLWLREALYNDDDNE
jgi:hypothetical protein